MSTTGSRNRRGVPDHPVVPVRATHGEGGKRADSAPAENEEVDPVLAAQASVRGGAPAEIGLALVVERLDVFLDVEVPGPADQHEAPLDGRHPDDRLDQVREEDQIRVRIADQVVARDVLRPAEGGAQQGCPELVPLDVADVVGAVLERGLGGPRFVTAEDHLAIAAQALPAADGVPLNSVAGPSKGLRHGEDRQHGALPVRHLVVHEPRDPRLLAARHIRPT